MRLNDIQKWQIEQMARNGGFTDRYIASYVFHTAFHRVGDRQKDQVTRHRKLAEIKLMDWRNGKSVLATRHAATVTKGKKRQRKTA